MEVGFDWDEFIGFEFAIYDRDEVVVHLLGLVFQVPIGVFVGFGFASSDQRVCWV